jgi:hypothetical protein
MRKITNNDVGPMANVVVLSVIAFAADVGVGRERFCLLAQLGLNRPLSFSHKVEMAK